MSEENIAQYNQDVKAIELAIEDLKSEYNQKKQDGEAKSADEYDSVENHEGVAVTTSKEDLAEKTGKEANTSQAYTNAKAELKRAQSTFKESEKIYKNATKEQGKRAERLQKDLDSELSNKIKVKQNEIKVIHKQIKNEEKAMTG